MATKKGTPAASPVPAKPGHTPSAVRRKKAVPAAQTPAAITQEELQSTNEELNTVNAELRGKVNELEQRATERAAELESETKERKQVALALRDSEQTFRALFQDAPVGICKTDPDEGRFLMVNSRFCAITGYSETELLGRPFSDITPPEDRVADLERYLCQGRGNGSGYQKEKRYVRKDGATLWADLKVILVRDPRGRPLHALAVINDITERKLLQTQLAEHSAQLQRERNFIDAILNTVAALIIVLDKKDQVVRYNTACNAATGYDFAKFLGNAEWMSLVPADEMGGIKQVLEKLRSGENFVTHENHWANRDGSMRLFNWCNTVLRDEAGEVQFVIGTGIDVTEQRKAEYKARETLEEAARLQRMQTANEFATLIAHELNQPLAAIASYAEAGQLLLRHTPLEHDKLTRNMEQISRQSLRAGETIRHMRAFVGRGKLHPGPLDLNAVIRSTCSLMVPRARSHGIHLALNLTELLPQVLGVGVHIEQVLLNLMRNAIDAIRDTGMASGRIAVAARVRDGMAEVSVSDSGPGIDAGMADTIFEPLSSKKEYGLGVGLRISRSLIEAHGGRLWVEPRQPGGIFRFVLPLAP